MPLDLVTPTKIRLPKGIESSPLFKDVEKALYYKDLRVTHEYRRWLQILKDEEKRVQSRSTRKPHWFIQRYGEYLLKDKIKELESQQHKTVLLKDQDGYYTYSGLQNQLKELLNEKVVRHYELPEWGLIPWKKKPFEPRWFQQKSLDLLVPDDLSRSHGTVSLGTGLGKSFLMALIIQKIGLPSVVVVPTLSIANQCLKDFKEWFGDKMVGQYFDSKKKPEKFIVVAVAKSLMNVVPGSEDWDILSKKPILLVDEVHTAPPDSLSSVLFGLFEHTPYRYSVSGTVFRDDGLDLLLKGITNDVVFELTVEQGINGGFLTPLKFFQYKIRSESNFWHAESLEMNKEHLRRNPLVNRHAAKVAMEAVAKGRQVLILIDEVTQFKNLLDGGLTGKLGFAYGNLTKDNKKGIPQQYLKLDSMDEVARFDAFDTNILVGTSAVGMGTDIKTAGLLINLVGLTSETRIRQGVGRGTRLHECKKDTIYVDYNVENIDVTRRHAEARVKIFNEIYGECKILEAKI